MKKVLIVLLLLVVFVLPAAAADELNTEQEKLGYAIGMNIGMNMKQQQVDADPDQVAAGLAAAFKGGETLLSVDEMAEVLVAYQQKMQQEMMAKMAEETAKNEEFLNENAKKKVSSSWRVAFSTRF